MTDQTDQTDRYFVQRCLDGYHDDFRYLVSRYQRPLLAGIRVRRVPPDTADDVAQEAFVRAFTKLATLRQPESFFPWLLGIAYRVLLERAGRERRERDGLARLAADARTSESTAIGWSGDAALEAALAALPDPCRAVILLRFYGDCSCREIADRLEIPIGTVTKRLSRAYDEIRHTLAAMPPGLEGPCPATRSANG